MPRTKRSIERREKLAQILDSAERLFYSRGYKATTMAAVARDAGVAPNAIYWYLPSKDHLLVAVLERRHEWLMRTLQQRDRVQTEFDMTISKIVAGCRQLQPLTDASHERASQSSIVADYHRRFHDSLRWTLVDLLTDTSSPVEKTELLADAILALVEGALGHEALGRPTEEIIKLAVHRLTARRRPFQVRPRPLDPRIDIGRRATAAHHPHRVARVQEPGHQLSP